MEAVEHGLQELLAAVAAAEHTQMGLSTSGGGLLTPRRLALRLHQRFSLRLGQLLRAGSAAALLELVQAGSAAALLRLVQAGSDSTLLCKLRMRSYPTPGVALYCRVQGDAPQLNKLRCSPTASLGVYSRVLEGTPLDNPTPRVTLYFRVQIDDPLNKLRSPPTAGLALYCRAGVQALVYSSPVIRSPMPLGHGSSMC